MAKQEQTNLQKLSSTLKDLSNAFKDSEGSLSDFIETAQKITAVMSIFETFGEIIEGNKEKFKAWRNIIEKFNEKLKKIPETFSLISKMMGLLVFNIPLKGEDIEKIDTFASSVKEKVGNAFDSVKGKLSNFKSNISGVFESLKTNPFGTISAGLTKLGGLANSVFVGAFGGGIALAGIAIGGFIAYFAQLMETNEEFKEKITEAWAGVKEAFQPIDLPLFFYRKRKATKESRLLQRAYAA